MQLNQGIIELVERTKKGDVDAFELLIHENKSTLYRIGINMLKSDFDTADAIQETLLLAYKNIHKLKDNQYFRTWLVRIMINECKKILRFKKREVALEASFYSKESYNPCNIEDDLRSYIEKIDFKLQQVILLKYYEGFKIDEIKRILNIPEGTVKTRLRAAKKQLYALIDKEEIK